MGWWCGWKWEQNPTPPPTNTPTLNKRNWCILVKLLISGISPQPHMNRKNHVVTRLGFVRPLVGIYQNDINFYVFHYRVLINQVKTIRCFWNMKGYQSVIYWHCWTATRYSSVQNWGPRQSEKYQVVMSPQIYFWSEQSNLHVLVHLQLTVPQASATVPIISLLYWNKTNFLFILHESFT